MEKTRDYSILKHLAARLGFAVYRLPRVRTAKETEIAEYQRLQAAAIQAVVGFFAGGREAETTLDAVRAEIEKAASFAKAVQTHDLPSLFEDEQ
jgi:hypothetical protein